MGIHIVELDATAITQRLTALSHILADSVNAGASISFMSPMTYGHASQFWSQNVLPEVAAGRRIVLGALRGDELLGTVQLLTDMPPNQTHRGEVAKMIVHPDARKMGIGRMLMGHVIQKADELGKSLVTLDTRTGDIAEALYTSLGFEIAGMIPDFAWDPDGKARHSTTYMFRQLSPC
ncbi:GNAT family N-acetyltransferase [Citrobacter sp. JGM124]|uniref:GNAT family N-acetyltransferase n=1 Tax=Citrobacter sp. JGM124 TaxID=2799789 RepID=UPI001BAD22AA|nr:GNAT family N-acetyltransferase [Citrobacter sp. JGM124]MBS0849906.1 GNAT family N-acetyltransferase [Citrobacter sp. JGM124]